VNSDNGEIINEIIRSIAQEYQWEDYLPKALDVVSVDSKTLDEYAGRFLVNPDRALKITSEKGKLYGEPTQSPKFELLAISETEFARADANVRYAFLRNASGQVDKVQIRFDGGESTAPRISDGFIIPFEQLMAGKIDEAIEAYKKVKAEKPDNAAVAEARLNDLGYVLLRQNKLSEAIGVFRVNVALYPQSSNVYDSLGEAYAVKGDKERAIANYRKSLELDPTNKNAVEQLKRLEQ